MFNVSVYAILKQGGKVLLCHRPAYDLWYLPGEKITENESPWEGIARIIKEQTGLTSKNVELTGLYHKPKKNEIVFQFFCSEVSGELVNSEEIDESKYFAQSEIPQNIPPKQLDRINDHFAKKGLVFKIQTGQSAKELIIAEKL